MLISSASRLPWAKIEAALAPHFARRSREGRRIAQDDLFGPSLQVAGAGVAAAGRPRLPIRLMASLLYLKHAYKLSDEELAERWAENVVWQHFSGMTFYEPRLPCDAAQIGRFRTAIGEAGVEELLKATIDTAVASKAIAHAKQFKRLRKVVKRQRTILGIVLREVGRKIAQASEATALTLTTVQTLMQRAERIRSQCPKDKNKLYALHAPEVECIGKVQGQEALRVLREPVRGRSPGRLREFCRAD